MSLVGYKIKHRSWGEGIVVGLAETFISVRFMETVEGEVTKKFIFPDALVGGFLVGADEESLVAIERTLGERKCSACGTQNVRTEEVDGKRLCSNCKNKYAVTCEKCGAPHYKDVMVSVYESLKSFNRKQVCPACAEQHSFVCENCHGRYFNHHRGEVIISARELCMTCVDELSKRCSICGQVFERDKGAAFIRSPHNVYVCPSCMNDQVFTCKRCGSRRLRSELVDTKYVPASENVCSSCARNCAACGEVIVVDLEKRAFGDLFCPDCWENQLERCSCCGERFLPKEDGEKLCPDCVEMEAYVSRVQTIDYLSESYKALGYYQLEHLNRTDLFTKLYENCVGKIGGHAPKSEDPFFFLVLGLSTRHKVIVTYLPSSVTGKVRYSENVTMTEFRSNQGSYDVREAIDEWSKSSAYFMDTAAGRMKILNYPVLLRVQTYYDQNYGKMWDGPYDYIEIGNYGDTTNFWIIGLLDS